MPRMIERLFAAKVEKEAKPGMYPDGNGLYLRITIEGTKNWVLRYMLNGRARWMGLGPFPLFKLADARTRAVEARRQRHDGIDPIIARRELRQKAKLEAARSRTFKQVAESFISDNKAGWRNAKHADQWTSTLGTYVYPIIGSLPVAAIDTALVLNVLRQKERDKRGNEIKDSKPLWERRPETASRLRGRIEAILNAAKVNGYRDGENPARWKGNLSHRLPSRSKVAKTKHHPALPWKSVGAFMLELRKQSGIAAKALEFAILTAARTNETIGAQWSEIDMEAKVWTIAAERMKAGQEHRIPLSDEAITILKQQAKLGTEGFVFESGTAGLSNMAMLVLLQEPDRMNRSDLTVHGFRSTFRDWAAETGEPADIAEAALAHTPGGKVIQAYQRGDLLDRRRNLMAKWAEFCGKPYVEPERIADIERERAGRSAG